MSWEDLSVLCADEDKHILFTQQCLRHSAWGVSTLQLWCPHLLLPDQVLCIVILAYVALSNFSPEVKSIEFDSLGSISCTRSVSWRCVMLRHKHALRLSHVVDTNMHCVESCSAQTQTCSVLSHVVLRHKHALRLSHVVLRHKHALCWGMLCSETVVESCYALL